MKEWLTTKVGRGLMKQFPLRICIVDDEAAYFSAQMRSIAAEAGFPKIERFGKVDAPTLEEFLRTPPDVFILDIRGITTKDVAKDGFALAGLLYDQTPSFIVITSAHKFHLHEYHKKYDYIIKQRLLGAVDFLEELCTITDLYLSAKLKAYKKLAFRIGFKVAKKSLLPTPN